MTKLVSEYFNFFVIVQASPSDPENFPFIVLGNKTDIDGGNSRVVKYILFYNFCILHTDEDISAIYLLLHASGL